MTVFRSGAFSQRETVGCEHRSPPLSGSRPQASLNAGITAQAVQVVGVLISAGDRQHPRPQDRRHRMGDHGRRARIVDQSGDAIDDADPAVGRASKATPPSEEIRPPSKAALTFLRTTLGRRTEARYRHPWRAWRGLLLRVGLDTQIRKALVGIRGDGSRAGVAFPGSVCDDVWGAG